MEEIKNIKLSFRCNENWNTMSACGEGRYCGVCQKIVIDFTSKDEHYYKEKINSTTESICGKFSQQQTMYTKPQKVLWELKWLSAILLILGFTNCHNQLSETKIEEKIDSIQDEIPSNHLLGRPVTSKIEAAKDTLCTKAASKKKKNIKLNNNVTTKEETYLLGMIIDTMPEYIEGGEEGMLAFIKNNLNIIDSTALKVIVNFSVDTLGNTTDFEVKSGASARQNEECIRIIKLLKFKPLPKKITLSLPIQIDFEE